MKYYITGIILFIAFTQSSAQLNIPAASPSTSIRQTVGLTDIILTYSRPSKKGRTLFGTNGLVRDGERWRMGANAATTIEVSTDITIQERSLPKGKYAVLSTPSDNLWTTHFYAYERGNWNYYVDKEPTLEITSKVATTATMSENLMIYFDNITLHDSDLILWWGTTKITLPINTNAHDKVLANIDRTLSGPSSFNYFQAALYLHETQTDLPKALTYIQKVTKSDKAMFFQVYREAAILADLGRSAEALKSALRSKKLSKEAGNVDFVRLNQQLIEGL